MKQRLCRSHTESFNIFLQSPINTSGAWWHVGWVDAFWPEGRGL